ncbi:PhzF family phenazine biosynthesis protein [Catenuloplanes sp. NPDC051500]|uniref:PhzF family phenazine biosynthesis protein n=1 Tax=Catenuloplanes sp. NPDC051500 TaxID=3363959 RepID=UPI0037A46940
MEILRYTAFSDDPAGGNPAGVVLDATGATGAQMLAVAAEVGYSETAFLIPRADGEHDVRYFSPLAEVPFCGHATIATAVAHADRHGPGTLRLHTRAGLVPVETTGRTATLVSVPPRDTALDDPAPLLGLLGWSPGDLDPALPPRVAFAGAWHPVIAARSRERLAKLDYDLAALGALMADRDWTTIALVWRESETVFHARNPFPPGGVFEDPATGAAAAALGGYLRTQGLVTPQTTITIHQGYDLGRPSLLTVTIPREGGISVTGTAAPITV